MNRPLVTIILAGGKGTRMGSRQKHKVCFEVRGVPVIIRALETYNLCGARLNVVVVGMLADTVMSTVTRRFPGTVYAFQDQPRGTGDAARQGAEILERMGFEGDVLVVAGDKVIEPAAIRRLLRAHHNAEADVTLATAKRPPESRAGILLKSANGNIVGILEAAERDRLLALATLNGTFVQAGELSRLAVQQMIGQQWGEKLATTLLAELWRDRSAAQPLTRAEFERRVPLEARHGRVRVGTHLMDAHRLLQECDQMNLSTYLFRAPVLYEALHQLHAAPSSTEEYLTDVFALLANRKRPARVVGCEIQDAREIMAFNNPQELLAIEEAYREKEGQLSAAPAPAARGLAHASAWADLLQNPSAAARRQYRQWYGEAIPWQPIYGVLEAFIQRYGAERPVAIIRSPGRINLLGRHIDHQGGTVNVMAIDREIILVAAPRLDDQVSLSNLNESQFCGQVFRIADLVANLNWDDWQQVVDGPRIQRLLEAARGDWANYVKAAILRLQEQFRDRRLRGMDVVVGGDIPMGAGLSSSSALVVATAEVVSAFNHLPVSPRRLVSLCGEGEWFVGTRGGASDHAAIKLSRRGYVTRVGFYPFHLEDSARFLPDHDLVVCNSGVYAGKSHRARNQFNEKVTAYHIGRTFFKMLRPDLASKIEHLRDLQPEALGLSRAAFAQTLRQLPERISRPKVQAVFTQMAEAERDKLARLFQTHDSPPGGYAVKDVVLFGLSEMARARRCLELLKQGDAQELGRLMAVSHDGDRVAQPGAKRRRQCPPTGIAERQLTEWAQRADHRDLADLSGAYGCSLPELDRIVDVALRLPGVRGAQLAGAGLGGCIMVLVEKNHTAAALKSLAAQGITGEVFRPIAGACSLVLA